MAVERTLSIIKPDAVANKYIGEIYSRFAANDLRIVAARMAHLTKEQAKEFYAVHKERPFYDMLVEYMISGPVMITVLEGEDAIARYRTLMGATMPEFAAPGSIRYDLARDGRANENAVHGSDAPETAVEEIKFFFKPEEICDLTR
ncbi:MAG: nucleoside-diphosphate kinase [Gammaproteobacteria bacterium]|nr:nucleoside-diphosphate kinase [Gammaproteobacteria bacterium]